jgi:predicted transport protein
MSFDVISGGKRFRETNFESEEKFEEVVRQNSKLLFGVKSVYINAKNRVESKQLGGVIPDGFLFDLSDRDDPQFYLVEVELRRHDFMKHVFPQLTKFFAFYRNPISRSQLIERLFELVGSNSSAKKDFGKYLRRTESHKSIRDAVENSQYILLISDDLFPEVNEIQETYTDTWGKYVKSAVLKQYNEGKNTILILNPVFDELNRVGPTSRTEVEKEGEIYNEDYHLKDVNPAVANAYSAIKAHMTTIDPGIVFNPQHYYISIRKDRNFAFIQPRTNKLKIVVMLPLAIGRSIITSHRVKQLSQPVQDFYNGPCFEVQVEKAEALEEVFDTLQKAFDASSSA